MLASEDSRCCFVNIGDGTQRQWNDCQKNDSGRKVFHGSERKVVNPPYEVAKPLEGLPIGSFPGGDTRLVLITTPQTHRQYPCIYTRIYKVDRRTRISLSRPSSHSPLQLQVAVTVITPTPYSEHSD